MQETQHYEDAKWGALFDLSFKQFITLSVIKVLYVLGMVAIAIGWLIIVIGGFQQGAVNGIGMILLATLGAVIYLIFYRVWLELIVVLFRIGENTSKLVQAAGQPPAGQPPEPIQS